MVRKWPLPVSATKPMPVLGIQLMVHSIDSCLCLVRDERRGLKPAAKAATAWRTVILQCSIAVIDCFV